jgi:hypothetical protein
MSKHIGMEGTKLLLSCADCHEIWEPQLPGTLRACPGLYLDCFYLHIRIFNNYFYLFYNFVNFESAIRVQRVL